mmetsp:Transcript_7898/g.29496  ORF Transcript_7898/g.29496 Transcript_7898/m.29496 type:complete len:176 (+) Transcript_7898:467-994(+)
MRTHLLLCVHGLGGSPQDFQCLSQSISNYFNSQSQSNNLASLGDEEPVDLNILSLESNKKKLTHCGLEIMGKKMAGEIEEWITEYVKENCTEKDYIFNKDKPPQLKHKIVLSVLSHSLGGLVARAGIKEMFFGEKREFFSRHTCLWIFHVNVHTSFGHATSGRRQTCQIDWKSPF